MLAVKIERHHKISEVQTIVIINDDMSVVKREFNTACQRHADAGMLPISEYQLQCIQIPNGRGCTNTRWIISQQWATISPYANAT